MSSEAVDVLLFAVFVSGGSTEVVVSTGRSTEVVVVVVGWLVTGCGFVA